MAEQPHVELFKGKGRQPYYLRLVAANGRVLSVSEGYFSRWNARRAARKNYAGMVLKDLTRPVGGHVGLSQFEDE